MMWRMLSLDLSSTTVFLDFDGTVTQHDSGVHLLNRTAGDLWRTVEDLYVSGAIGAVSAYRGSGT